MFTGIVIHQGQVRRMVGDADRRLEIVPGFPVGELAIGGSVAHSGVCLTVARLTADSYWVDAGAETLARTTLGEWREGQTINLERSLRLGDELGGHLVFGHVDAVATVRSVEPLGQSWCFRFTLPEALVALVAVKGSIAVDGISLTVTAVDAAGFAVMVIPHSFEVTTLAQRRPGDHVNVEVDMLARYVARQLTVLPRTSAHAG